MTMPSISTHHENNFATLKHAFSKNNVCLMLCADAKTGEHATVICMLNVITNSKGQKMFGLEPVATMIEGNPFAAYLPPEGW